MKFARIKIALAAWIRLNPVPDGINNQINGAKNGVIGGPFIFLHKTSEIRVGKMVHTY